MDEVREIERPGRPRVGLLAIAALAALLGGIGLGSADTSGPSEVSRSDEKPGQHPLPEHLPMAAAVKDPVFGILVGLVEANQYGSLTHDHLQREITRQNKKSHLPYRKVREFHRIEADPGRTAMVRVQFDGNLKLDIPYSILGYNPGSFSASDTCIFREWLLGNVRLRHAEEVDGKVETRTVELEDVHLFGLSEGKVSIDIDGWLDNLMGGALDDTDVTGLLLFRYRGEWVGMAVGYSKDRHGRSGAFSFVEDKVIFPSPAEMKTVGRTMRSRMEELMAGSTGGDSGPDQH